MSERDKKKLLARLLPVFEAIYTLKDRDGFPISDTFQRLPLRTITDYYKIVKKPLLLHSVGRLVKNGIYAGGQDFINDLVLILWNARLYNHKDSRIYHQALVLKQYIVETVLPKLASDKTVPDLGTLIYPDLGELPDGPDLPKVDAAALNAPIKPEPDYESLLATPVHTPQHMAVKSTPRLLKPVELGIRRGRPPIIDKPFEIRIKGILKGFKKLRDPNNELRLLVQHFEKLPDAKYNPGYYAMVANPILLNEIKVKVRLRKYALVDQFINDLNVMLANTKLVYERDPYSQEYIDFENFSREAGTIIQAELLKLEQELISQLTLGTDGVIRIPFDLLEVNGYTYRIGDWVLIDNPNDPEKPTVGQIFRLWTTDDGNKYTNVCWYYRPEQTCHKEDRLFFINEVCKTGQYRDHLVLEIVGPCYVVFLTRYQKGDLPEGVIPEGLPWFICEFRYNELLHVFNRIRTWKACLPDEVRDLYEQPLIPLHEPRKLVKYELPIRALLPADAHLGMAIPEPSQGALQNTPPLTGLVFIDSPVPNDDLGQYILLPNILEIPERNDPVLGRRAYLFTPISQLKGGGGATNAHYVAPYQAPMQQLVPPVPDMSFPQPVDGGFKPLQTQMQETQVKRQNEQQMLFQQQLQQVFRRTGDYTGPPAPQAKTLVYLGAHPGGVVLYALPDVDGSLNQSLEQILKRARLNDIGQQEIDVVFFRAPPMAMKSNRIVTTTGVQFGHLASYLAWKLARSTVSD